MTLIVELLLAAAAGAVLAFAAIWLWAVWYFSRR